MKKQLQYFLAAVMYYTRIPVPSTTDHSPEKLNKATKFIPLIGWIVGGVAAFTLYALSFVLPYTLALLISMAVSVLLTGAFHEDGFADFCDGFGGGWTKAKILDIMKDSRIGTYGMVGLVLVLLIKFFSLNSLPMASAVMALCIAHPLSRFMAMTIIYTDQYVRENDDAKAKPVAMGLSLGNLLLAGVFAILPLVAVMLYLHPAPTPVLIFGIELFVGLLVSRWYMVRLMRKWIGGYTGDCLGATQQVAEIVIYICCCLQWAPPV